MVLLNTLEWVVINTETHEIIAAFSLLGDASRFATQLNNQYQTDANIVHAFKLYFKEVR